MESVRLTLPTPYFASGEALETTKEAADRYRPLLRTHCEKCARGRCVSADRRNTQELKGIRAEMLIRERGVIILFAEAGWGLFDRMLYFNYLVLHERSDKPIQITQKSTSPPM